jgi:tetratricopeptide (TPR) repeat protein
LACAGLLRAQNADPREALEAAQRAEKSGDLPTAQALYEKVLTTNPSAETYQRLGLVLHLQNKFSEAGKAFDHALQLNDSLWVSHLFLGIDEYRMNHFPLALSHLTSAERLHPGQLETSFWLGATHLALHEYWAGFECLELVLTRDPDNVDALRLLAESYADRGTQLLNRIAEEDPDSAAGLQVQGRAFEFEGSYDAALQCYRKAAAKDPRNAHLREAIARLSHRPE